jgi:hypothetical protein
MTLTATINSVAIPVLINAVQCSATDRLNQRRVCKFGVADTVGYSLSELQQVSLDDDVLGNIFTGFIDSLELRPLSNTTTKIWVVTCKDNFVLLDKRIYTGDEFSAMLSGDIACFLHGQYMAAEGILADYVQEYDFDKDSWNAGTLTSVTGNTGDLTLSASGTNVEISYPDANAWNETGAVFTGTAISGGKVTVTPSSSYSRDWNNNTITSQTFYSGNNGGSASQSASGGAYHITSASSTNSSGGWGCSRLDSPGTVSSFIFDIDLSMTYQVNAYNASYVGITYGTTYWTGADMGKMGYMLLLMWSQNNLGVYLYKGTNSSGTSTLTQLTSRSFSIISGTTYHLKVLWAPGSHKIYFNNDTSPTLSSSDATYTSGGIGLYSYAFDGGYGPNTNTSTFDNLVMTMYTLPATWVSASKSISGVGTVGTSKIAWTPTDAAKLTVHVSLNAGSTWQACTNGGVIPGCSAGTSVSGKSVLVRATLTTADLTQLPEIDTLHWYVYQAYATSGNRVSPALDPSSLGNLGGASINYTVDTPVNTTATVQTSIDNGSTWDNVESGSSIPGLSGKMPVVYDSYDGGGSTAPLTLYGSSVADGTLTTACGMAGTTGGSETSVTTTTTGATTHYAEVLSQAGSTSGTNSLPSTPTHNGWVYRPGAGAFAAGTWTLSVTISASIWGAAGDVLTLLIFQNATCIGTLTAPITGITKTTYTLTGTALSAFTMADSDVLEFDLFWQDAHVNIGGDNPVVYVSSSVSQGVTNDMAITTAPFTAAPTADYTLTNYAAGGDATLTVDTVNGKLNVVGGTRALAIWNASPLLHDGDLYAIIGRSDAGGLVLRYQDANNFYAVRVADASASTNPGKLWVTKRVASTDTQIVAPAAIPFVRGDYHVLRVSLFGSVLTAYWDGVEIAQVTDTGLPSGGQVGYVNTTGTAYWYSLTASAQGVRLAGVLIKTKVTLTTSDTSVTPKVSNMALTARGPTLEAGMPLTTSGNRYKRSIASILDAAAARSGLWWTITAEPRLLFQSVETVPAPWVVSASHGDILLAQQPKLVYNSPFYRNRQYITDAVETATEHEARFGDGKTITWTLQYPVFGPPTILVNTIAQAVGILGVDQGRDFYYSIGERVISQDKNGTVLLSTDVLDVTYPGGTDYTAIAEDTTQQTAIATLMGGTGIIEASESALSGASSSKGVYMLKDDADALAQARIDQYDRLALAWSFSTQRAGLAPGMLVTVFSSTHGLSGHEFLVQSVATTLYEKADGSTGALYDVDTIDGALTGSWHEFFASIA